MAEYLPSVNDFPRATRPIRTHASLLGGSLTSQSVGGACPIHRITYRGEGVRRQTVPREKHMRFSRRRGCTHGNDFGRCCPLPHTLGDVQASVSRTRHRAESRQNRETICKVTCTLDMVASTVAKTGIDLARPYSRPNVHSIRGLFTGIERALPLNT